MKMWQPESILQVVASGYNWRLQDVSFVTFLPQKTNFYDMFGSFKRKSKAAN